MRRLINILILFASSACLFDGWTQTPDIKMIFVKGGTFSMGCTSKQGNDCSADERPAHQVTVSDFYIGKYEITQSEWEAVMNNNPSYFTLEPSDWKTMKIFMAGVNKLNRTNYAVPTETEWNRASVIDGLPVEQISWSDVHEFIRRLNAKTGKDYRLPTEAEWEYAARGGTASRNCKYSGSDEVGDVAWYGNNSGGKTHLVGTKKANELGIYDMCGNVSEWTGDKFGYYDSSPKTDPKGEASGDDIVFRGGGWNAGSQLMRVTIRLRRPIHIDGDAYMGLRLARSAK
ncbi:MAG: formylglycine-generating enzyme family protein [Tannerella sp.]|jgi:formylglycine-generating enzyme required for sulfatase activity|nr:formylglycine-generating enzyme family protein [Tannerella sp.]